MVLTISSPQLVIVGALAVTLGTVKLFKATT